MHNTPHPKMENSTAKVAEDESRILAGSSLVSGVIAPKLSTAAPSSGGGILFAILGMGEIFQNLEMLEFIASHRLEHLVCVKMFFLPFLGFEFLIVAICQNPPVRRKENV